MADPTITEIENEIRSNKIMIYMKGTPSFPQCGFSAATIEILEELGHPFGSVDVLSQPAKRDAIKRYSNWPTIPQVYVDGKFIAPLDAMRGGVAVTPGVHRFELRHEDFFSSYLELTLAKAERKHVSLDLSPVLP